MNHPPALDHAGSGPGERGQHQAVDAGVAARAGPLVGDELVIAFHAHHVSWVIEIHAREAFVDLSLGIPTGLGDLMQHNDPLAERLRRRGQQQSVQITVWRP